MTAYIIQVQEKPDSNIFWVDTNGWLQPDKGLAERFTTSAAAQAVITAHYQAYGTTGTIVTVSS